MHKTSLLRVFFLSVLALCAAMVFGQDHVQWSVVVPADSKPGTVANVELKAKIDKGWHLYSTTPIKDGPSTTLITADSPLTLSGNVTQATPIKKLDQNFNKEVEYYEDEATFTVPVKLGADSTKGAISVRFQVCNDNTCMPPKTVSVPLAAVAAGFGSHHIAWSVVVPTDAKPGSVANVELKAKIEDGWHLYSLTPVKNGPSTTVISASAPLTLAGKIEQQKPLSKLDQNFGVVVEYYEGEASFTVPVKLADDIKKGAISVNFQVCNATTCMPPFTADVPLSGASAPVSAPPVGGAAEKDPALSVEDEAKQGLLHFAIFAFSCGLLTLLTPCVFPMVPITVSYFSKKREGDTAKSGLIQAGAYSCGIIATFAIVGVAVAAIFGASGLQSFATNPWTNLVLAVIFVFLALNLFGIVQLTLPSSITNRFSPHGKSGLIAPILMGVTFTLTSFTCSVPFVGAVLVSAANGNYLYPLVGMLAFGTAFALPFFLLALFPSYLAKLPKSGVWLETVKAYMGFIEIAAAVKFLSNADLVWSTGILPRPIFIGIWCVILLAAAIFLLGFLKIPGIEKPEKLGNGRIITAIATLGIVLYLGTAIGGRSLGEVEAFMPPSKSKGWLEDYDSAIKLARQTGKPVLINFTGVTCTNCRWMEKNMFPRDEVVQELKNYVPVELYTDRAQESDRKNQALQVRMISEVTLPAYVSVTPDGKVLAKTGTTRDADAFVKFLQNARKPELHASR